MAAGRAAAPSVVQLPLHAGAPRCSGPTPRTRRARARTPSRGRGFRSRCRRARQSRVRSYEHLRQITHVRDDRVADSQVAGSRSAPGDPGGTGPLPGSSHCSGTGRPPLAPRARGPSNVWSVRSRLRSQLRFLTVPTLRSSVADSAVPTSSVSDRRANAACPDTTSVSHKPIARRSASVSFPMVEDVLGRRVVAPRGQLSRPWLRHRRGGSRGRRVRSNPRGRQIGQVAGGAREQAHHFKPTAGGHEELPLPRPVPETPGHARRPDTCLQLTSP